MEMETLVIQPEGRRLALYTNRMTNRIHHVGQGRKNEG